MPLRYEFRDTDGSFTEIVGRIRFPTREDGSEMGLTEHAEEGSVATSQIIIDDPDMDFEIAAFRAFHAWDDDDESEYVYVGFTTEREIIRDESGLGRRWIVSLVDLNSVLSRRLMTAASANRPEESDVERVEWGESNAEGSIIDDYGYLLEDDPVEMDAVDYRLQSHFEVLRDCAEASGKNFYMTHFGPVDSRKLSLWYGPTGAAEYASDAALTNVAADVDADCFIVMSAKSNLRPDRVFSKVILPYRNSHVIASNPTTVATFTQRDTTMPAPNVTSKAKAQARANRYVNDIATEEERISVVVRVERADIHRIRPGMMVDCRFLHIPSVSAAYVGCRVLSRTVTEPNLRQYELALELSPPSAAPASAPPGDNAFGILHMSKAGSEEGDSAVWFAQPGDTPPPGYAVQPTVGDIEVIQDTGGPYGTGWSYQGWKVNGTGTLDVAFYASTVGVLIDNITYSITYAIRLNGSVVASEAVNVSGFLVPHGHFQLVTVAGLAVEPDDEISATITCIPPTMPFFRSPLGTGQEGERLEITGGTLA
jgi:hypothetical protein